MPSSMIMSKAKVSAIRRKGRGTLQRTQKKECIFKITHAGDSKCLTYFEVPEVLSTIIILCYNMINGLDEACFAYSFIISDGRTAKPTSNYQFNLYLVSLVNL